eukprot:g6548.t1
MDIVEERSPMTEISCLNKFNHVENSTTQAQVEQSVAAAAAATDKGIKRRSRRGKQEVVVGEKFESKWEEGDYLFTGMVTVGSGGKRLRHGLGLSDYGENEKLLGIWENDLLQNGRIYFPSGTVYIGNFFADEVLCRTSTHGFGRQVSVPECGGWTYTGFYNEDSRQGFGSIVCTEAEQIPYRKKGNRKKKDPTECWLQEAGSRYLGFWSRDKRDGWGWFYYPPCSTVYKSNTVENVEDRTDPTSVNQSKSTPTIAIDAKITLVRFQAGNYVEDMIIEDAAPGIHAELLSLFEEIKKTEETLDSVLVPGDYLSLSNTSSSTASVKASTIDVDNCKGNNNRLVTRLAQPKNSSIRNEIASISNLQERSLDVLDDFSNIRKKESLAFSTIKEKWMSLSKQACQYMIEFAQKLVEIGRKPQLLRTLLQYSQRGRRMITANDHTIGMDQIPPLPSRSSFFMGAEKKEEEEEDLQSTVHLESCEVVSSTMLEGCSNKRCITSSKESDFHNGNESSDSINNTHVKKRRVTKNTSKSGRNSGRGGTKQKKRKKRTNHSVSWEMHQEALRKLRQRHKKELAAVHAELDSIHEGACQEQAQLESKISELLEKIATQKREEQKRLVIEKRKFRETCESIRSENAMELDARTHEAEKARRELRKQKEKTSELRNKLERLRREVVRGGGGASTTHTSSGTTGGAGSTRTISGANGGLVGVIPGHGGGQRRRPKPRNRRQMALLLGGSNSRDGFTYSSLVSNSGTSRDSFPGNVGGGIGFGMNDASNESGGLFSRVIMGGARQNTNNRSVSDSLDDCMPG